MTQAYEIIRAETIDELVRIVNDYLDLGWKIVGGVAINAQGSVDTFYQTIYTERR